MSVSRKRGRPSNPALKQRNAAIVAFYLAGHTIRETAAAFRFSHAMIGKIVRGARSDRWAVRQR